MAKFKPGDRVIVLNFQKGMIGTVVPDNEQPELRTAEFTLVVQLDNGEYWNYRDEDLRKLTKLEEALT